MTPLLEPESACAEGCEDDRFPWKVSAPLAAKAIKAERDTLAALGPLAASGSTPPALALVTRPCRVDVLLDGKVVATPVRYRR